MEAEAALPQTATAATVGEAGNYILDRTNNLAYS